MKKLLLIFSITFCCIFLSCLVRKNGKKGLRKLEKSDPVLGSNPTSILPASTPPPGDPIKGYEYLVRGNAFRNGIPLGLYKYIDRLKNSKLGASAGFNKYSLNDFVIYKTEDGNMLATPGCLHCHAQQFNDSLIIGLGNSYSNFQVNTTRFLSMAESVVKLRYGKKSPEWKETERTLNHAYVLAPEIITQMQGPTPAHQIAEVMASHRDPQTLIFRPDTSYFEIPSMVVPIDAPPLWLEKKKKALAINAMQQGNLLKHLMSPTILSLKDSSEARKIYDNIKDVWAYLLTLEPPKYPMPIHDALAQEGKIIFEKTCSACHGSYGENESYPNILVPPSVVGTDSMLWKYYSKYTGFAEWFNKSWFAQGDDPGYIKPQKGYVPPALDGVWVTAPYFHNGSVPTLEQVLNSKTRPRYWKRDFNDNKYDYEKVGWKYKELKNPGGKRSYNTSIPGYGNYGHTFGDVLTKHERLAVIEYLKTL